MSSVKKVIIETEEHTITLTEEKVEVLPDIEHAEDIGDENVLLVFTIGKTLGWG